MPSGTSILKEVYVASVRIDPAPSVPGATGYVFSVSSCQRNSQDERSRLILPVHRGSISSVISLSEPRESAQGDSLVRANTTTHDATRTYSECRRFYLRLLLTTNSVDTKRCVCNRGACPFWTTYRTLKAFPFPRKTMFPCELRSVRRQRCVLLHSLFTTLFQLLEEFPDDCFQQSDECLVLKSIEEFLGLNEEAQKKLRDEADGHPGRLNLRGWQSDRKNLYFQDEVRPSLLPSDDEEDEEEFDDHDVMLVPMNCYRRRCPST